MIQINERIGLGDVTDDVEFADRFMLRGLGCSFRGRKPLALERILRPLPRLSQVFEGFAVFDEYVHRRTA